MDVGRWVNMEGDLGRVRGAYWALLVDPRARDLGRQRS